MSFWRNRNVLITGHTGFKGSWLSLWLQSLEADVVGYALSPPTEPSLFQDARVAEGMLSLQGDVRDLEHLEATVAEHQPEVIFHLAAQPLVRYAYENPIETYTSNVMGTVNVLEAVRRVGGVRAVVCVTTDKCYENKEWLWAYRESDGLGGGDPYSSSKACAELVVSAYRNSYFAPHAYSLHGVAVASVRAGNVIGGGDWAKDRLVPDAIRAFMDDRPLTIRNPRSTRPWQHVTDPLAGYLRLAESLHTEGAEYAEAWNFGPNAEDAKPVGWIVEQLVELWGDGVEWRLDGGSHPREQISLNVDSSKARAALGWSPKLRLATALEWTVEWYRAYARGEDLRSLTKSQIAQFTAPQLGAPAL